MTDQNVSSYLVEALHELGASDTVKTLFLDNIIMDQKLADRILVHFSRLSDDDDLKSPLIQFVEGFSGPQIDFSVHNSATSLAKLKTTAIELGVMVPQALDRVYVTETRDNAVLTVRPIEDVKPTEFDFSHGLL